MRTYKRNGVNNRRINKLLYYVPRLPDGGPRGLTLTFSSRFFKNFNDIHNRPFKYAVTFRPFRSARAAARGLALFQALHDIRNRRSTLLRSYVPAGTGLGSDRVDIRAPVRSGNRGIRRSGSAETERGPTRGADAARVERQAR